MKRVVILLIAVLLTTGIYAHNNSKSNCENALAFQIIHIATDSSIRTEDTVAASLAYDFRAQYPFYKINKKDWKNGDLIQLRFSDLPDSGYLYVFTIDSKDRIKTYNPIQLASVHLKDSLYFFPSKDSAIMMDTKNMSNARICIWYALKKPVDLYEELIHGMELTHGSIMQRIIWQIGQRLYLPCTDWRLLQNEQGIELLREPGVFHYDNLVIPIVTEFTGSMDSNFGSVNQTTNYKKNHKKYEDH